MDESRRAMLQKITADDINAAYRNHELTKRDEQHLLREKGQVTVDDVLGENGYLKAVFLRTITHYQKSWDNLVEAATNAGPSEGLKASTGEDLYNMGLGAAAMIQGLFAPLTAFGEVNGAKAEKLALAAGASPGAARVINITVDIGSGFVPVGMMAKSLARTAQKVAGKVASGGEKAGETIVKVIESEERVIAQAIEDGLKMDGVEGVESLIGKVIVDPAKGERVGGAVARLDTTSFIDKAASFTKRITKEEATRELPALARKFGIDLETMHTPGAITAARPMTARQSYGYLKALEEHTDIMSDLAKKALTGSDEDAIRFAHYATDLFTQSDKPTYTKPFMDLLMHWDADAVARGDILGAMRTFAGDMASLSKDELIKFTIKNQEGFLNLNANWWGISKELYANILLPMAWAPAFVGNTFSTGLHLVEKFTGAAFSGNRANGLTMQEGVYWSKGLFLAMSDGLKLARDQFLERGIAGGGTRFDIYREIPGAVGRVIRKPTDAVIAMDTFFKTILERASFYAQYAREGVHAGLSGSQLGNYVTQKMANAWPPPQHIWQEANDLAMNATFQNHLGQIGTALSSITQNTPAFFYFPFFKSFANLTKYAWNRTPGLQFLSTQLYKDLAAGGVKADEAIGRLTVSNMLGMYMFELAKEGLYTGAGPVDPKLRKAWQATHEPYSFKTSKGWMPMTNMEPATQPMGMIADFVEVIDQLDDATIGQMGMAITYSIMKNFVDKGSWHTVGGLTDVIQKLSSGQELSAQDRDALLAPVLTVTSGGPLMQRATRALDPTLHETRQFLDSWRARVPGFSQTVPPRRDGYGDPIIPPTTPGTNWFGMLSPLIPKFKPETTDAVKIEGDRVQASLPAFEWSIGGTVTDDFDITPPLPGATLGVPLNPEERDKWQQIYGNLVRHPELGIEAQLLNTEKYKNATPTLQRVLFEGLLSDYKSTAQDIYLEQNKPLMKKLLENDVKSVLPLVKDEAERTRINQSLKQSIDLFMGASEEERGNLLKWGNPETIVEEAAQ